MKIKKLNEDILQTDIPAVETDIVVDSNEIEPNGPAQGIPTGIANVLHDLIIDENEAIKGYNNAAASMEEYPELVKLMHDIASEEFAHVGELQKALETVSPNVANIMNGEVEAEEKLDPGSPIDESINTATLIKNKTDNFNSKSGHFTLDSNDYTDEELDKIQSELRKYYEMAEYTFDDADYVNFEFSNKLTESLNESNEKEDVFLSLLPYAGADEITDKERLKQLFNLFLEEPKMLKTFYIYWKEDGSLYNTMSVKESFDKVLEYMNKEDESLEEDLVEDDKLTIGEYIAKYNK